MSRSEAASTRQIGPVAGGLGYAPEVEREERASGGGRGPRRWIAWAVSLAVHAAALLLIWLALENGALVRVEPEPEERLVFIEPAPPPPPPLAGDGGAATTQGGGSELNPPEFASSKPAAEAPESPKVRNQRVVSPKKRSSAREQRPARGERHPSAERERPPVPRNDAVASKEGQPNGLPGGIEGGKEGGKLGGVVGGSGDAPIPVELAGRPPVLRSRVLPTYPETARLRGREGQVLLRAVIDRNGRVESEITVVRSDPDFDAAAIAAFHQWVFDPARDREGRPIRVVLTVPMRFQIR